MKRLIIISLIILSGIIFSSCTTCPVVIPPASTTQGQVSK